eukprot:1139933-Pelagomonas_calceolata.AAC.3
MEQNTTNYSPKGVITRAMNGPPSTVQKVPHQRLPAQHQEGRHRCNGLALRKNSCCKGPPIP